MSCKRTFTWKNKCNKVYQEKVWFDQWMIEGYSIRQLANLSGHSQEKIRSIIRYWLDHPPKVKIDLPSVKHLIIDGTFLLGRLSILAVMNASDHSIVAGEYGVIESSTSQVSCFLQLLKKSGLDPISCTTDGNPSVVKAVQSLWPDIVMQRCVVHVQRQGLMWCRRYPNRTDAKHLRDLFLKTTYIRSKEEQDRFLTELASWEDRYGSSIQSSRERGKVFSDVKRARSMLLKAIPNMFHYLDNPDIPKSTNGLEGYFSRLKQHYRQHRGLSRDRRKIYFNWYFTLRNR